MMILFPDATFDDDAAIERKVLPKDAELILAAGRTRTDVADDLWRRADAVIPYIEIPIDGDVIDRLDNCKIIVRAGVGFDHIDIEAAARRGIPVCNVPDYGSRTTAPPKLPIMPSL